MTFQNSLTLSFPLKKAYFYDMSEAIWVNILVQQAIMQSFLDAQLCIKSY
jgi:hypothetical protein